MEMTGKYWWGAFFLLLGCVPLRGEKLALPMENREVANELRYLQTTEVGKHNGGFGLVREGGKKFHGGIDIRPVKLRANGEPADEVRAVGEGQVVYINKRPAQSSYGTYVVVEHENFSIPVLSLYAHLADVDKKLEVGTRVGKGAVLGIMGRTSNDYTIPKDRAHLHFEMGLRLGAEESFTHWYGRQKFGTKNCHGRWNGMNWVGFDPLPILRTSDDFWVSDYVKYQPTAFVTKIYTTDIPDFLLRNGALWNNPQEQVGGFEVEWTWYGLPKRWRSLPFPQIKPLSGGVLLVQWRQELLDSCLKRETLKKNEAGGVFLGKRTRDVLEKIFGERAAKYL
jgi:hypothetical protein